MTNEDTGPWALNVSKSGEAAAASSEARAAELEQFYAEGTTPLAETTPSVVQQFQDDDLGLPEIAHIEYRVPYDADGNYHVPDHVGDTMKIMGRPPITEAEMSAVVDEVLDQTITEQHPVYHPILEEQVCRIEALEAFNKKLLAALKQHGFDTNKLFR